MDISQTQQDLLDRFLQGKLSGTELDGFLNQVENDSNLSNALQSQKAMAEGIESYGNAQLRNRFQKISAEVKKETRPINEVNKSKKGRIVKMAGIAAAVAAMLILISVFFFQKDSPSTLFANYYKPYSLSNLRTTTADQQTLEIEQLYSSEKYAEAIPLLTSVLDLEPKNSKLQLALGNAFLNTGDTKSALSQFQKIIDNNDALYRDQATWFAALTHLKMENVPQGTTLLKQLAEDEEADYHTEAKKLLADL